MVEWYLSLQSYLPLNLRLDSGLPPPLLTVVSLILVFLSSQFGSMIFFRLLLSRSPVLGQD